LMVNCSFSIVHKCTMTTMSDQLEECSKRYGYKVRWPAWPNLQWNVSQSMANTYTHQPETIKVTNSFGRKKQKTKSTPNVINAKTFCVRYYLAEVYSISYDANYNGSVLK
jgi:hypothetical protein